MLLESNRSIDNIIEEFKTLGLVISREEIEKRRNKLKMKLQLMKDLKDDKPTSGEALKNLVNISLEENKIVFDRLAQL